MITTRREIALTDRYTIEEIGVGAEILMESAGREVASLIQGKFSGKVGIVVGPGNNGGDGYVVARTLRNAGFEVELSVVKSPESASPEFFIHRQAWFQSGGSEELFSPQWLMDKDLIVDAIFGVGLNRTIEKGAFYQAIRAINESGIKVVSVDIASGIDADSGMPCGIAIRAAEVIALEAFKWGHFLGEGKLYQGQVHEVSIGLDRSFLEENSSLVIDEAWVLRRLPARGVLDHKYSSGCVELAVGSALYPGAIGLALKGCSAMGASFVISWASESIKRVFAARFLETVFLAPRSSHSYGVGALGKMNSLVLGSGWPEGHWESLPELLREHFLERLRDVSIVKVVDAGAAHLLEFCRGETVWTPHEGEFCRHEGIEASEFRVSPLECLERATARLGVTILLKGPSSVIASVDGRRACMKDGSPRLAQAGSGDLLAGAVGALAARGLSAFDSACAASWLLATSLVDLSGGDCIGKNSECIF